MSKEYKSTQEGGMFVELWVIQNLKKEWMISCGGNGITTTYSESLVGTDKLKNNDLTDNNLSQSFPLQEKLFPGMPKDIYESVPLYACINLGSTGWSGYNNRKGYWRCKYEHLNNNGKTLYNSLKMLYGDKGKVVLVTWLDT
jgi:hypothetical protein